MNQKTRTLFLTMLCLQVVAAFAVSLAMAAPVEYIRQPDGVRMKIDGGTLRIQFWSPEIVRVSYAPGEVLPESKSFSVVSMPSKVSLKQEESRDAFSIASEKVQVRIDRQTGAVNFLDRAGRELLEEAAHGRRLEPATVAGDSVTSATQSFDIAADEGIYGLGQHQQGAWNYDATGSFSVKLAQANTEVGIPVMTSSKGYMLLWDNRSALHRAHFDYDPDEYRLLYRVLVRGEQPIGVEQE